VLVDHAGFLSSSLSIRLDEESHLCAFPAAFEGCPPPSEREVAAFLLFFAATVPRQEEQRAYFLFKVKSEQKCLRTICNRLAEVLAASLVAQEASVWFSVCQSVSSWDTF
jgi:hypothetical protein